MSRTVRRSRTPRAPRPRPRTEPSTRALHRLLAIALLPLLLAACGAPTGPTTEPPSLSGPTPERLELRGSVGGSTSTELTIGNTGDAALTYDATVATVGGGDWLTVEPTSGTVGPGESRALAVTATCGNTAGAYSGTIRLATNDPAAPEATVEVAQQCVLPPPPELICEEVDEGAAGPSLICWTPEEDLALRVPWQGRSLTVEALPTDGLQDLPEEGGFQPLRAEPVIRLAVEDEVGQPVTNFDPPLELAVAYAANDFAAANPQVANGEILGELGLGAWDREAERWLVVGKGVYRAGFWVADPIGGEGLELQGLPGEAVPRYAMRGAPQGGASVALFDRVPADLVLNWGALPPDPDRMFVAFDTCVYRTGEAGERLVECVAEEAGVTVRVPFQPTTATGEVWLIDLPWNLERTLDPQTDAGGIAQVERSDLTRLMNFLVVDATTGELITSFDPPMEFEIAYGPEDFGEQDLLQVLFWDELVEDLVVLGEGNPVTECFDPVAQAFKAGCPWGRVEAAEPTDDPAWIRATEDFPRFFKMNPPEEGGLEGNGRAKFYYHEWGDRMVAFGH